MFAVNGSIAKFLLDDGSLRRAPEPAAGDAVVRAAGGRAACWSTASRLRIARADVARMAWLGHRRARARAAHVLPRDRAAADQRRARDPVHRAAAGAAVAAGRARAAPASRRCTAPWRCRSPARRWWWRCTTPAPLDGLGIAFAVAAAVTFALYLVGFERAGHRVRRVHHAHLGPRLRDAVLGRRQPAVDVPVRATSPAPATWRWRSAWW